ncbi:MAG: hypothetical protein MUO76_09685 [Anaerolineaceae bacterium]|nr:hypothetical protein [Anaerolineaceae bacterium]
MIDQITAIFGILWPAFLMISISSLALFVGVLVTVLLIKEIFKIKWEQKTVKRWIRLHNDGNLNGIYHLRAENQGERLKFEFLFDGEVLPNAVLFLEKELQKRPAPKKPGTQRRKEEEEQAEKRSAKDGLVDSSKKAKKKSKAAVERARRVGAIFGTLGSLLPGSVGKSFKDKANAIQSQTQEISSTIEAPEQAMQDVEHIKGQAENLKPDSKKKDPAGREKKDAGGAASDDKKPSGVSPGPGDVLETEQALTDKTWQRIEQIGTAQTPLVPPGEVLTVELQIEPVDPYQTEEYRYSIQSHQILQPDTAGMETLSPIVTQSSVGIQGIPYIYRIITTLLCILVAGLNGLVVIFFLQWFKNVIT